MALQIVGASKNKNKKNQERILKMLNLTDSRLWNAANTMYQCPGSSEFTKGKEAHAYPLHASSTNNHKHIIYPPPQWCILAGFFQNYLRISESTLLCRTWLTRTCPIKDPRSWEAPSLSFNNVGAIISQNLSSHLSCSFCFVPVSIF